MTAGAHQSQRVAVLGATGAVGSQILELLGERGFGFSELRLFASENHAGESLELDGNSYSVEIFSDPDQLRDSDICFLATKSSVAGDVVRARPGPVLIDLSAAGRKPGPHAMVAPGLSERAQVTAMRAQGVFEVPHPATVVLSTVLRALGEQVTFAGGVLIVGASAEGNEQINELMRQSADLLNARLNLEDEEQQLAFNLLLPDNELELTSVIEAQLRHLTTSAPPLMLQVLRAPLFHGAGLALNLPAIADSEGARDRLRAAPGLILIEDDNDSASTVEAAGQEAVLLTVRVAPQGMAIWCSFDSARRAALSARWIAECLQPGAISSMN